jgi:glycine cleavage system aminomethyltransferase T
MRALFGRDSDVMALGYYFCCQTAVAGIPVVVSRTGWTGEVGYEIYLRDQSRGQDLWDAVMRAGEPFEIKATAPSDQRRMDAGIFNYGNDITIEDNPFQVSGLERLVECLDSDVGHIGKEALRGIRDRGVTRKLVGLEIGGAPLSMWLEDFWPVRRGGETIGRLTSACYSPRLNVNLGYAWVPIQQSAKGTAVEIESPQGTLPATVVALPFLDPGKAVPKG